jgi:hypothetical protein
MPYFEDLTPYTYCEPLATPMFNVGWLSRDHAFPTGDVPARLADRLHDLCRHPVVLHRGYHCCDLCPPSSIRTPAEADEEFARHRDRYGNGQIRIRGRDGVWFAAPQLIGHYVTAHRYRPPEAFLAALEDPDVVGPGES